MTPLSPMDLDLLDFLCICAEKKIKVVRVNVTREAALARLRDLGLVHWNRFEPSPSALVEWIERRRIRSEAATCVRVPDEPPAPKAADACGDGAARKVAPSPKRKHSELPRQRGGRTTAERARRFEEKRAAEIPSAKGPHPSTEPPAVAPTADESAVAADQPDDPRPAFEEPARPVDLKVNARRRTSRPSPVAHANEAQAFQRQVQRAMRTNRANAEAFLDSGKTSAQATSVSLKIEARKVELARIETARLEDPIEQAKTVLRPYFRPVVGAEYLDPPGKKGTFLVGRRLVTEAQLLAQAEQLRARRRVG